MTQSVATQPHTKMQSLLLGALCNKELLSNIKRYTLRNYITDTRDGYQKEFFCKNTALTGDEREAALQILADYGGTMNPYWLERNMENFCKNALHLEQKDYQPICNFYAQLAEELLESKVENKTESKEDYDEDL